MPTFDGTDLSETLSGTSGDDFIYGLGGSDSLSGGDGNDHISGGAGDDTLLAAAGFDSLFGGDGNDKLYSRTTAMAESFDDGGNVMDGGAGDDLVTGGRGNDSVVGGFGNDELYGSAGDDTLEGQDGNDYLSGNDGSDSLVAGAGKDSISGGAGNDLIYAGDDDDSINYTGDTGDDTVYGGNGNDLVGYSTVTGNKRVYGEVGDDTIRGGLGNDTLDGGDGNDSLTGNEGNDSLVGDIGNDTLFGSAGDDEVRGGDGDDSLLGGDGNDSITGDSGDDYLSSGVGDDTLDGGLGNDTLFAYSYSGIKKLYGQAGSDTLSGGIDGDVIDGGDGRDSLSGYGGDDSIIGGSGDDTLSGFEGVDTLEGQDGDDSLNGGDGNDSINGDSGNDYLSSGAGNDILDGGEGNDTLSAYSYPGIKRLYGQSGSDTLWGGIDGDVLDGGDGHDSLNGYEGNDSLVGGAGNDTLYGSAGDDTLEGQDGDDFLVGNDGNNSLVAGAGNDSISGGTGNDLIYAGDGDDKINYTDDIGDDTVYGGNGNDLVGYSTVTGNKRVYGEVGDDTIRGGLGNDTLDGGDGNDSLTGNEGNDSLVGGIGNDTLYGSAGDDTLDGNYGGDSLNGGDGNDTYYVDSVFDRLIDTAGTDAAIVSVDWVKVPSTIENVSYVNGARALPYWISALVYDGASGRYFDTLLGDANTFFYAFPSQIPAYDDSASHAAGYKRLNSAQIENIQTVLAIISEIADIRFVETDSPSQLNTITFALNDQTNSGGYAQIPWDSFSGSDIFFNNKDYNSTLAPKTYGAQVLVHELGHALGLKHPFDELDVSETVATPPYLQGDEDRTRWTQMSYTDSPSDWVLSYSPLDIAALQYLYGPSKTSRTGNDSYKLEPGQPNFIWDGAGTDTLNASTASLGVTLSLESGDWSYFGTSRAATITSAAQITINFGSVIENAIGTPQADKINGNLIGNQIQGEGGEDYIDGLSGNDSIYGGSGNDSLYGGDGEDIVSGNDGNDEVMGGAGKDTVYGGNGDDSLSGDAGDDNLRGLAGNDSLAGGEGNDYLGGDDGDDWISGGLGNDTLNASTGRDTLFGGAGDDRFFARYSDTAAEVNDGGDVVFGGEGNDSISGGNQGDQLLGDEGDDLLAGFGGDDTLSGGAGSDRAQFSGDRRSYTVAWNAVSQSITVASDLEGIDELIDIETLLFKDRSFSASVFKNPSPPTVSIVTPLSGAVEDSPYSITYAAIALAADETDAQGDLISFRIDTVNRGALSRSGVAITGTITLSEGEYFDWTPPSNAYGTLDAFTIRAVDSQGLVSSQSVQVKIQTENREDEADGTITIAGDAAEAGTLVASIIDLVDSDGAPSIAWQWQQWSDQAWVDIPTAKTGSFLIPSDQSFVGKKIRVTALTTDLFGGTTTFESSDYVVRNVNDSPSGAVNIGGVAEQYQLLTASNNLSDADGLGTISYQWQADGINIAGATGSIFTLTQAQVGKAITVVASYTDQLNTAESVASAATTPVANVNDQPTGAVTIAGTATQGQTLTVSNTLTDADEIGTISYQWQADGANIAGATGSTLVLSQAQVGKTIRVIASYADLQGTTETVASATTTLVANVNDAPTGTNKTVAVKAREAYLFVASDFGFADPDAGDLLVGVRIDTLPLAAKGVLKLGAALVAAGQVIDAAQITSLKFEPVANVSGVNAAAFTFSVRDGQLFDATPNTISVDITAPDWAEVAGRVYHWKNHALLSSVSLTLESTALSSLQTVSTSSDGNYALSIPDEGAYRVQASRSLTTAETGSVVSAADALAALKLSVGINPNSDPDGTGPLTALPVSPYQFLAADVNGDGRVSAADALAILKMAVKRSDAPSREWLFVNEAHDFWNEAAANGGAFTTTRSAVPRDGVMPGMIDITDGSSVNLVAVLKGDVNGNWQSQLDVPQGLPDSYFRDLSLKLNTPAVQWGIVG
jgi:Ca2+-binding RTX toxin-like protein